MADDNVTWDELPAAVREAIEEHTGPVAGSTPGGEGVSTMVRLILRTADGSVFIKGISPDAGNIQRWRLDLGAELAPYVNELSPPLLFRARASDWDITGWPALPGRPSADLAPGSPDIPKVSTLLATLGTIPAPDVEMRSAGKDWAGLTDDPRLLDGNMLVHNDPNPTNFVVDGDRAWLVDWGWAMRGPAWMTAARLIPFLIEAGWKPADAEQALTGVPAWAQAPHHAVTAYATANAQVFEAAYQQHPGNQHRRNWRDHTRAWASHRAARART